MIPAGLKRGDDDDDDDYSSSNEEDDHPPKKQSSVTTTTTTNKKKNGRVTFQTTTENNNDDDKKYNSNDTTYLHNNSINNSINNNKTNHGDENDNNHPSRKTKSSIRNETNMEGEKECSIANSNDSRQQNHESSSLTTILLERIRQETQELYQDTNASIANPELILHLLQLSAGDIEVAMDFFWDHYLATASTMATTTKTTTTTTTTTTTANTNPVHKRKRSPIHPQMAAAKQNDEDDDDDNDDDDADDSELPTRRIRLEQNNPPQNNENVPMEQLHEQPLLPPPAPNRNLNDDQLMDNNNEIQNNNDPNHHPNPQPQNVQDAAEILDADENQDPIVESVSISDDEGVWRMERRQRPFIPGLYAQRNHRIRPENNDDSIQPFANLESQQPPQPIASNHEAPDDDDDDDDDDMDDDSTYISEDDWCTSNSTGINTPQDPSKILWGRNLNNNPTGSNPAPNHDDTSNNNAAPGAEAATPSIPRTWMFAGFQMAEDGGGLTLKPPSEDELLDQLYQQHHQNVGGKKLPFHCKSLTIILSIVQAIMLTGATVQVNTVDCTSLQTSFAELSQDQRIQQFNRRLEDAIVALLFVAIQASTSRKQRIIQNHQNQKRYRAGSKTSKKDNRINQDFELMQHQSMTRRLRLCPTCQWSEDSVTTEGSQANRNNPIQVITTLTHRSDLRYYVKSNLKKFQSSRGCALLLETIIRIHGQGTVDQMIRKSRRKCGLSMDHFNSLISCSCHADPSKTSMTSNLNRNGAERSCTTDDDNDEEKEEDTYNDVDVVDSAPFHRQECASIELMSLLICGEVHSTFHGWSSGSLGFGILSKLEDISDDLTKPFKPVWILRGDLVHSLAWVPTEKLPIHFDIDQPGANFPVSHWNPWYEPILPKKSNFRIHIQRTQLTPPTTISPSTTMSQQHKAVPGMVVQNKSSIVEKNESKTNATQMPITIQRNPNKSRHCNIFVEQHPDDPRFYPDMYHRWRFQFHDKLENSNKSLTTTTTTTNEDDPIRLSVWNFYSSLTSQERDIVDSKWAHPLHSILKSRWPKCTIDTLEDS
jgi:hypothetical protein